MQINTYIATYCYQPHISCSSISIAKKVETHHPHMLLWKVATPIAIP